MCCQCCTTASCYTVSATAINTWVVSFRVASCRTVSATVYGAVLCIITLLPFHVYHSVIHCRMLYSCCHCEFHCVTCCCMPYGCPHVIQLLLLRIPQCYVLPHAIHLLPMWMLQCYMLPHAKQLLHVVQLLPLCMPQWYVLSHAVLNYLCSCCYHLCHSVTCRLMPYSCFMYSYYHCLCP